jgi:ribonuclease HI
MMQKTPKALNQRGFHLFVDGSCNPNPGLGGWGFVLYKDGEVVLEDCGSDSSTTNNRMELQAAIEAVRQYQEFQIIVLNRSPDTLDSVTIHSDSMYVVNGMNKWINGWKKKGWDKLALCNKDLWKQLDQLVGTYSITWQHVKGHSGIVGNERADNLALKGRQSLTVGHSEEPTALPELEYLEFCLLNKIAQQSISSLSSIGVPVTTADLLSVFPSSIRPPLRLVVKKLDKLKSLELCDSNLRISPKGLIVVAEGID